MMAEKFILMNIPDDGKCANKFNFTDLYIFLP